MAYVFKKSHAAKCVMSASDSRAYGLQFNHIKGLREASDAGYSALYTNAGRSAEDFYREVDDTILGEAEVYAEFALLNRIMMNNNRQISLGKTVSEYVRGGRVGKARVSMHGRGGIETDKASFDYDGTVVPVFDTGVKREWLEVEGYSSEDFDEITYDLAESEKTVMRAINDYLWTGEVHGKTVSHKGYTWGGIKADGNVAQETLSVDLTDAATTGAQVVAEIKRIRDVGRNDNSNAGQAVLVVSTEIDSKFDDDMSTQYSNKTIRQRVLDLGGIGEIMVDNSLVGNQLALVYLNGTEGLHSVTAMPISTYPVERLRHNDPYEWIKWAKVGFQCKVRKTEVDGEVAYVKQAVYAAS